MNREDLVVRRMLSIIGSSQIESFGSKQMARDEGSGHGLLHMRKPSRALSADIPTLSHRVYGDTGVYVVNLPILRFQVMISPYLFHAGLPCGQI